MRNDARQDHGVVEHPQLRGLVETAQVTHLVDLQFRDPLVRGNHRSFDRACKGTALEHVDRFAILPIGVPDALQKRLYRQPAVGLGLDAAKGVVGRRLVLLGGAAAG